MRLTLLRGWAIVCALVLAVCLIACTAVPDTRRERLRSAVALAARTLHDDVRRNVCAELRDGHLPDNAPPELEAAFALARAYAEQDVKIAPWLPIIREVLCPE